MERGWGKAPSEQPRHGKRGQVRERVIQIMYPGIESTGGISIRDSRGRQGLGEKVTRRKKEGKRRRRDGGERTEEQYRKQGELERRKTEENRGGKGDRNEKNMSEKKGTWGQARGWIKASTKLGYKWLSCTSRHM